jgi:transcriptional regulator with XRE-family HTH domain
MFVIDVMAATTWQVGMPGRNGFAAALRSSRRRRGWSQLELAGRASISPRHLGFLELGRAAPSRAMVIHLATALGLSLRQQNSMLLAAGFAPAWSESEFDSPQLAQVRSAIDYILAQQEPFPAVAVDRRWNLLDSNESARRLLAFLVGEVPPDAPINLADALARPDVLRPFLANWDDVVRYFVRMVEADSTADGTAETATLLDRLLSYEGVRPAMNDPVADATAPVLAMHFRKGDVSLRLCTTIATLGTPQDVTAQELRVESFFPMDAETAATFRAWAAKEGH